MRRFSTSNPSFWRLESRRAGPQARTISAVSSQREPRAVYPYFKADNRCSACDLRELASPHGRYDYRIFYPPGYDENVLKRYPVIYMQDGQNLFFPGEAFQGHHWRIAETLSLLDSMNLVDKVIVVGVYPNAREENYTRPGYEFYGRFLAEALKPEIDRCFRTLPGPATTAIMGSSLGGVVSFYLAWQYPELFGMAACLSSTFGWRDNLKERVSDEPRRHLRLYIDSGWPRDNYESNRDMRALLVRRGFREGDISSTSASPRLSTTRSIGRCAATYPSSSSSEIPRMTTRADAPVGGADAVIVSGRRHSY